MLGNTPRMARGKRHAAVEHRVEERRVALLVGLLRRVVVDRRLWREAEAEQRADDRAPDRQAASLITSRSHPRELRGAPSSIM